MTFTNFSSITQYVRSDVYARELKRRAPGVFIGNLDWFLRKHKTRLVDAGALLLRRGPGGNLVDPNAMDQLISDILREESDRFIREARPSVFGGSASA